MKKLKNTIIRGVLIGSMIILPQMGYSTVVSFNTDILAVGAPANTAELSTGSGWAVVTTPPTATFGDAFSRSETTVYQSTASVNIANTTAVSTMTVQTTGAVGSATFPSAWVAPGRSIRITLRGNYNTSTAPTWNWQIYLGTTSIIQTTARIAPASVSTMSFTASALLTVVNAGATGSVNAAYDVLVTTASGMGIAYPNIVSYGVSTGPVSVDLTSQLTVNPTITWGTQSTGNSITIIEAIIEALN